MRTGGLRWLGGLVALLLLAPAVATAKTSSAPARAVEATTRFYVPPPSAKAVRHEKALVRSGQFRKAALLGAMLAQGHAVWFTDGTPEEVNYEVRRTMRRAAAQHAVPVLVAYFIPGRDCQLYSQGGALSTEEYLAWIDAFASGIGDGEALVILEPDGLGLLPSTDCGGPTPEYPFTDEERYLELNSAVDRLGEQPNVSVYLDGTHSAWLASGEIAKRLDTAGVQRAHGFFVNVSNYQFDDRLIKYATWISSCIAFANNPEEGGWRLGHYEYCASQYYPADPDDFSTWHLSDEWYEENLGSAVPTIPFVIDTSRNGLGPNDMSAYGEEPYNQPEEIVTTLKNGNWCNPPGRGVGIRPTDDTGVDLLDAYLWVKVPGESDGQCNAAGGVRAWDYTIYSEPGWPTEPEEQELFDPLWGVFDPAAGDWFPQQAMELARLANPSLCPKR